MKKLFTILITLAVVLTACTPPTDDGEDNTDTGAIGTTGPGGGYIFFAEGDQFMECSGELGSATHAQALTNAKNHKGGGFTDWHLPTGSELDLMYNNLKKNDLGGFSDNRYWTSAGGASAYYQDFTNGSQGYGDSSNTYNVRAVRSYSTISEDATSLNIKNQSYSDLEKVIWQGVDFDSISAGSNGEKTVPAGNGYIYFTRKTNHINARTRDTVTVEQDESAEFIFLDSTVIVDVDNPTNTGTLSTLQPVVTSLTIKNESFTEITDVIWQSISFANNQYENSIKTGTNVNQNVTEGAGYIFFRRKTNPVIARTSEMIIINKGESKEFTFNDNTAIVEVNNTGNTGTLGAMETTVVWFDDAEGDLQPYHESRSIVEYYSQGSSYRHTPKNGSKSIAVGGTNTALLHLRVNLDKKAKFSFWYANKAHGSDGTLFSINGEEKNKWTVDVNWSRIEFDLEAGVNDLIWEKKDGYYYNHSAYSYYLSLDDILIYYTE